ncbi:MAG: NAD-glutamate dehydrogenase domain-containing protein [Candidatus Binataceae bacterium]
MSFSENLQELIEKGSAPESARRLAVFAEQLFARIPADVAQRMPGHTQLELAQSAFDFFSMRSEPVQVRVSSHVADTGDVQSLTAIESAMADCPFIVATVREFFHQVDVPIRLLLHPIVRVSRDAGGRLLSLESASAGERAESFVHVEIETIPRQLLREIQAGLKRRLELLLQVNSDTPAMTARAMAICDELAGARELIEVREFLRWLVQDGLVFLGYRRYTVGESDGRRLLALEPGSGLGILRAEERSRFEYPQSLEVLSEPLRDFAVAGSTLVVGKTRSVSEVYRCQPMDDIALRRVDSRGQTVAFDRFLGLFTSTAAAEEAQYVPILRAKLKEVLEAEHALPGSHDFKELVATFNSFPKEELFRASAAELRKEINFIFDRMSEDRVSVYVCADSLRGMVVMIVMMRRERFSSEVEARIEEALARQLEGAPLYRHLAIGDYTARLHFAFAAAAPTPALMSRLEREVVELAQSWEERLHHQLSERMGEARGLPLAGEYSAAFGAAYKASTEVSRAVADVEQIEAMLASRRPAGAAIYPPGAEGAAENSSELRMYELGQAPALSELMPLLQNFAIRVLSEVAHELTLLRAGKTVRVFVQAFVVQGAAQQPLAEMPGVGLLAEALTAVRGGLAQNDQLDALTLSAALSWREVALIRAYLAAAFQMKLGPAPSALRRVFLLHPELARRLIGLFAVRLDPAMETPPDRIEESRAAYLERLSAVDNIVDDRIARALLSMVEATTRTNYFQPVTAAVPYIALKFESGKISNLPDVAPLYEIHVNSARMEGCHLRAGKIARGGIRFSDRLDDYRTEILSLMKTQTVKNAIIVPVGAKGGFIVRPRPGQTIEPADVVEAYTTLISAMLDLTDNLADGEVVRPAQVKVLDDDGPYLVVAADKGTAKFSDLANELAGARGYWLGDAFASGGRHGYDHKKFGITARGAWESAKRHLREMGRDPQRGAPATIVGIGDMSGDVFGNGLLQSANAKLIAAFDHRHIFIDPNPDPASSFAERKRLYELPNSQWADYTPALISAGGGVFRRGQKRITLSAEARAALGIEAAELDGDSLVRAILLAGVDLIYNGGIGTYVRASDETDAQVGDHANDACRVAANELRAKIVVEGGNLGFTQKARIEYALGGGRINTDAIDNSAGVDLSDHEVNLKILLQPALKRGTLSLEDRNRMLEDAADQEVGQVLRHNRDQVLSLSLEQIRSRTLTAFRDHLTAIENRGLLRRHEEALPSHEDLAERRRRFPGLTRPELAVLSAYTKIDLSKRLDGTELIGQPYMIKRFLMPYFPPRIAAAMAAEVAQHPLRRALIATELVNELVDSMGSTFIFCLTRDHNVDFETAVRTWLIAADMVDFHDRVEKLKDAAGELGVEAETSAILTLGRAVDRATCWALTTRALAGLDIAQAVERFKPALALIISEFDAYLAGPERERLEAVYRELRTAGHAEEPALEMARLAFANHLLNVISVSLESGSSLGSVAAVYFGLGEIIDFAVLERAIETSASDDRWEQRAAQELGCELLESRARLTRAALIDHGGGDAQDALLRMTNAHERALDTAQSLISEIKALKQIGLPALQVAIRALARLV